VSLTDLELPAGDVPSEDFGRVPPQDVTAEQSVLGGMLLSKDAIADVAEELTAGDFYRPAHELIYTAVTDLFARGEPADAVTVAAELTRRGEIGRIGGAAYLHTLLSSVPTAANAAFYARIVRERAVLRRLVQAGTKIVQLGYATDGGDVDDLVNAAQAEVYAVTERRKTEDYLPIGQIIEGTIDEIEAAGSRGDGLHGVPTGFRDLDQLTHGLQAGQMIVIAARPAVGKSTVGLDICRSAAIRHKLPSVIFSLEMSRTEITMRLLSAEAGIPLQHMRRGGTSMRQDDWDRLARTMGAVSEAPLFIDDSPNMSLMEIRAKCRRLKQRHGLRLVVVDYLQLMTSGKKVESRQQEVSEFSRALKLLAKELEVPVIAISQLNRGPEQRTDKRPMVSDLRESGCLTADTRILRADTGAETTMGELFSAGARDVPVWSLDDSLRYVRRQLTHVFPTGRREVFTVRLASGKQVRATASHPFLTYEGWRPIGELAPGSRVAVPRHVPAPEGVVAWTDDEVRGLAGRLTAGLPELPWEVSCLSKRQIALLVRTAWSQAGSIRRDGARIELLTVTRRIADQVSRLLLRFGISGLIGRRDDVWCLSVTGIDDQRRFLQEIGVEGRCAGQAALLLAAVRTPRPRPRGDLELRNPWEAVRQTLTEPAPVAARGSAGARGTLQSRQPLARVAALLDDAQLEVMAVNDVFWDEVVAVEPDGVEEVYDATVIGNHNFVANGIAVHNSIEQDADMVILLHREDMYEKESPRAGEADFIVAKHRNGPTDTITVAFQGHYSRFVDMAT
jgi:replicative DNA helicase